MRAPDPDVVAAAAAAWIWVPDEATTIETADHLLVRFPDWFTHQLELARFTPSGDVEPALEVALTEARTLAADEISCWVRLASPPGLDDLLLARGARLEYTADVLAVGLGDGVPDLGECSERLVVRWATTPERIRDFAAIGVEVFDGKPAPEDRLVLEAERTVALVAAGGGGRCVAYLDGEAVGAAGLSLVEGDARLWSGGVRAAARHRGVYRALLRHRLAYAVEHGATLGILTGLVDTSAPILRRAGFTAYGQERSYLVPLGDDPHD